jgi:XXXCH domain-containing protein
VGSGEKLVFKSMTQKETARLFRELADRMEGNPPASEPSSVPELGDFRKMKIAVKRNMDDLSVKIKLKSPKESGSDEGIPSDDPENPKFSKYKDLKKRMKVQFKKILESLETGALPPETVVTAFLADSKLMIRYPKYGAEFFGDYDQACTRFRQACESHDPAACKAAAQELDRLKSDCHKKYK